MEPVSIITLITVIVTFIITIFQSIKFGHFKSKCGKASMEVDMVGK